MIITAAELATYLDTTEAEATIIGEAAQAAMEKYCGYDFEAASHTWQSWGAYLYIPKWIVSAFTSEGGLTKTEYNYYWKFAAGTQQDMKVTTTPPALTGAYPYDLQQALIQTSRSVYTIQSSTNNYEQVTVDGVSYKTGSSSSSGTSSISVIPSQSLNLLSPYKAYCM